MEIEKNNCKFKLPEAKSDMNRLIEEINKLPKNEDTVIDC